jgi:hypothetical protein
VKVRWDLDGARYPVFCPFSRPQRDLSAESDQSDIDSNWNVFSSVGTRDNRVHSRAIMSWR